MVWGDAGATGKVAGRPVSMYGRNSASGTYGFFKSVALCNGDFKNSVKEQPGSSSVVNSVSRDIAGIGYSGVGYRNSDVKMLAVAKTDKSEAYPPTYENVINKSYPLGRELYVYIVIQPGQTVDAMTKEFLLYVLSKEGQEVVLKDGYMPLPASTVSRYRAILEQDGY